MLAGTNVGTGIHHEKESRPVGVFGPSRCKGRLSKQGRLLISQDGCHGDTGRPGAQSIATALVRYVSENMRRWTNGGQTFHRQHVRCHNSGHTIFMPLTGLQIHKQPATGIGHISAKTTTGIHIIIVLAVTRWLLPGQLPEQPRVDGPKTNVVWSFLDISCQCRDVIQQPLDFGAGKVTAHGQSGNGCQL